MRALDLWCAAEAERQNWNNRKAKKIGLPGKKDVLAIDDDTHPNNERNEAKATEKKTNGINGDNMHTLCSQLYHNYVERAKVEEAKQRSEATSHYPEAIAIEPRKYMYSMSSSAAAAALTACPT